MTELAVDWVTLSTPEFVAWTRLAGVGLPFPLSSGAQAYVPAPDRDEIERTLARRQLSGSPVLAATRDAFTAPRLAVYAVRAVPRAAETAGGPGFDETKYVAIAAREEHAVLVLLDRDKVAVRQIADTELAAGVVGALPVLAPMRFAPCEVAVAGLQAADEAVRASSSASPRTVRTQMSLAGLPEELIAARLRAGDRALPGGALGALSYPSGAEPTPSPRSAGWREYPEGAVLHAQLPAQRGEPMVQLAPLTPEGLFRAAVDAVASCYEAPSTSSE